MKHRLTVTLVFNALLVWQNCLAAEDARHEADVCVYGGTASGVMAALAAEKEGSKVILIEPSRWLGGMTGGGINHLDWGKGNTVGGSTYKILMEGVKVQEQKHHGGHARQGIGNKQYRERFKKAVEDRSITVIYDHRLGEVQVGDAIIDAPTRQRPIAMNESFEENKVGNSIRSITLDYAPVDETGCPIPEPKKRNAVTVSAKVFIDCSYEGDLLGMSGVCYTWGRESREHYDESLAGVRPSLWVHDIDPYVEPGKPASGLIPFVQDRKIGPLGSADALSMGYCFRYEFDGNGKGIPIPEPTNYDPAEFEVYRRAIRDGVDIFSSRKMRTTLGKITDAKRGPFVGGAQSNRNLMGSTVYGCNDEYPNGDWATRSRIWKFHQEFLINAIHFATTDPVAPKSMKQRAMKTSFRKGVFDETGGWPNQLYVRQARRMVSSYVVTQKDLEGKTDPPHTVGLAAYGVDDWPYAVVVEDGKVAVQGGAFSIIYLDNGKYNGSYKIPYEAIVPRKEECDNLIVPVCVSASHIAFTSLRMEPVWMILGESAGVAAAMAVNAEIPVQDVPYKELRKKLDELDQTLDRIQGPIEDQKEQHDKSASWKSQDEWNKQKKGWEWLFPHIDTDSDGQISAKEYNAFQKYKVEHKDWEELLRKKGAQTPRRKGALTPTEPKLADKPLRQAQDRPLRQSSDSAAPRRDTQDRPNLIVIMADDLGFSDLGCYGGEIETPHIDRLAEEGVRFTGFKNTCRCAPSRASLLTGRYQHAVGVGRMTANDFQRPGYRGQLSLDAPTLAEILKPKGYGTGIVGKWHLTVTDKKSPQKPVFPLDRGFDLFHGTWWGAKDYFSPKFMMTNREHLPEGKDAYPKDYYLTHDLSNQAIQFVTDQIDEQVPFFLYLAHYAPHAPIQAPADRIEKCRQRYQVGFQQLQKERFARQQTLGVLPDEQTRLASGMPKWDKLGKEGKAKWVKTMATYAAMIEIMDDGIGELIEVLKEKGEYENTLILFLSDNGSTNERKGGGQSFPKLSNTPYRGQKAQTWEGGTSSPLIVSWPARLSQHAGAIRHGRCHIIDILPTCLEATGVGFPDSFRSKAPAAPHGGSLLSAVGGAELPERPMFWEHGGSRAVYQDGWKLVADRRSSQWNLYNLRNDPTEQKPLNKEFPERVDGLKELWQGWAEEYDVVPMPGRKK